MPRVVLSCRVCGQRSLPARLSGGSSCNRNLRGEKSLWLEPNAAPCLPREGGQPWSEWGTARCGAAGTPQLFPRGGEPRGAANIPRLARLLQPPVGCREQLKARKQLCCSLCFVPICRRRLHVLHQVALSPGSVVPCHGEASLAGCDSAGSIALLPAPQP